MTTDDIEAVGRRLEGVFAPFLQGLPAGKGRGAAARGEISRSMSGGCSPMVIGIQKWLSRDFGAVPTVALMAVVWIPRQACGQDACHAHRRRFLPR